MTQYEISLLGERWRIFLISADELPEGDPDPYSIYILPDPNYDVTVRVGRTLCRDLWLLRLLLDYFYTSVIGYPKCTLDVAGLTAFELEIFDTPPGIAAIRLPKCKRLLTNRVTLPDGTTHTVYTALCDYPVRVITCDCGERIRPESLTAFLLLDGLPDAREVIALSSGNLLLSPSAPLSASALVAAATVAGDLPVTLCHGSCEITVSEESDSLLLTALARLLSKKII